MKRWMVTAAAVCFAAGLNVAYAQAPAGQPQDKPGGTKPAPSKPVGSAGKADTKATTAKADLAFVREAAQGGMAEVELGKLASEKAANADVKQFGQRMVDDHSKANDELKSLASQKSIELPADIGAKNKAVRDKLSKLSGEAFDRAYMSHMVQDHNQAVTQFQQEAKGGRDSELKAFADKHLPHLREHQKMARDLAAKTRGPAKTSGGK